MKLEWYEKTALIFAVKVPKINYQGYHFLDLLGAEPKSPNVFEKGYPSQIFFKKSHFKFEHSIETLRSVLVMYSCLFLVKVVDFHSRIIQNFWYRWNAVILKLDFEILEDCKRPWSIWWFEIPRSFKICNKVCWMWKFSIIF